MDEERPEKREKPDWPARLIQEKRRLKHELGSDEAAQLAIDKMIGRGLYDGNLDETNPFVRLDKTKKNIMLHRLKDTALDMVEKNEDASSLGYSAAGFMRHQDYPDKTVYDLVNAQSKIASHLTLIAMVTWPDKSWENIERYDRIAVLDMMACATDYLMSETRNDWPRHIKEYKEWGHNIVTDDNNELIALDKNMPTVAATQAHHCAGRIHFAHYADCDTTSPLASAGLTSIHEMGHWLSYTKKQRDLTENKFGNDRIGHLHAALKNIFNDNRDKVTSKNPDASNPDHLPSILTAHAVYLNQAEERLADKSEDAFCTYMITSMPHMHETVETYRTLLDKEPAFKALAKMIDVHVESGSFKNSVFTENTAPLQSKPQKP